MMFLTETMCFVCDSCGTQDNKPEGTRNEGCKMKEARVKGVELTYSEMLFHQRTT
jgi:hypothetical protein